MTTPPNTPAAPHDEEAAAVWRRLKPKSRAFLVDLKGERHTQRDFPRELVALGLVDRRGAVSMLGHDHVLTRTDLGHRVAAYGRSQTR